MRLIWMKSDYVIPADSGGKIRTYNLLRELHRICDVTYVSFKGTDTPNDEPEIRSCASHVVTVYQQEEKKNGLGFHARVLRSMASPLPYVVQKYRSPKIVDQQRRCFQATENRQDTVLLCDFLEMAENVDWTLPCPKVLLQHNVESQIWRRYFETETNPLKRAFFNFERKRMSRYERKACNRFDWVFTVSEHDKVVLQDELDIKCPIEVLESGVDSEYFKPRSESEVVANKLVFLGSLDWMPNMDGMHWFTRAVYPLVKQQCPAVTLDIVGRRPGTKIRQLAANDSTIQILADVPDVRPHVAASDLFIVPLRIGGGSRIKIYEAMAMRRPVVSTTLGAEGLPLTPDQNIAIGDSPIEFAAQVVRLLKNPDLKRSIASSGFELVTENYQWTNVALKLRDRCLELTKSK